MTALVTSAARSAPATAIPAGRNLVLAGVLLALNLGALFGTPWLLEVSPARWWLLLAFVLSTPTLWALIHEAVHGMAHPDKRWNEALGRVLSVSFGSPFQLLRLGHFLHHRYNRTELERGEVVEPLRPGLWSRLAYYVRLSFGLYAAELAAALLAVLPDAIYRPAMRLAFGEETADGRTMWRTARHELLDKPGRRRMRLDGALIVAGLGASLWLYGADWWMLALALLGRAFLVSFHDNLYHYGTPLDDVRGGYDLRLPRAAQALLLNFNLHRTHHLQPWVPWSALREAHARSGGAYAGNWLAAGLRQWLGPIPEARLAGTGERAR